MKSCIQCGRIIPVGPAARCAEHEARYQKGRQGRRIGYASKGWLALRDQVRTRGLCEDCGDRRPIAAHHRFSVRDGHPVLCRPELLVLVCRHCHLERHNGGADESAPALLEHRFGSKAAGMRQRAADDYRLAHPQPPPWGDRGPLVA
jgi:hypothetical protein